MAEKCYTLLLGPSAALLAGSKGAILGCERSEHRPVARVAAYNRGSVLQRRRDG